MRVLIIGSLSGELGQAGRIAMARGARLDQADDSAAALARLRADARTDLVLCDIRHDVGALVRALAAERIAVPVVACGTGDDPEAAVRAIRDGAREFLSLPPDPGLIAAILTAAAGESHALIARDPAMQAAVRRAEQVAGFEASVLISGESGTGKEVLARHIHRRSRRSAGPFVALNCAAIPEGLLESELFGHEKGAFSGALARRVGKFEGADGGTLLLDEVSEMDLRLQAKLLRALQEREIDRLGGAGPVKVNVRILATTNRDLAREAERGTFREDLYFRLNVVSLRVPPLRERPGDVAALAEHFARRYAEVNGIAFRPLSPAALAALATMPGEGTCASWRTPSIARCCWPRARRSGRRRSRSRL
jgi:two-component system, response regulator FlrC